MKSITPQLDDPWVTQIARNVTYVDDGFLCGTAFLILDVTRNTLNQVN
jgi:hypothetical protein